MNSTLIDDRGATASFGLFGGSPIPDEFVVKKPESVLPMVGTAADPATSRATRARRTPSPAPPTANVEDEQLASPGLQLLAEVAQTCR